MWTTMHTNVIFNHSFPLDINDVSMLFSVTVSVSFEVFISDKWVLSFFFVWCCSERKGRKSSPLRSQPHFLRHSIPCTYEPIYFHFRLFSTLHWISKLYHLFNSVYQKLTFTSINMILLTFLYVLLHLLINATVLYIPFTFWFMLPFLYVLLHLLIHADFSLRSPSPFDSCYLFSTFSFTFWFMLTFLYVLLHLLIHVAFSLRSPSPFDSCQLFSTFFFTFWFMLTFLYVLLHLLIHADFSLRSPSPFDSCWLFSTFFFTFWFMLTFLYVLLHLFIHAAFSLRSPSPFDLCCLFSTFSFTVWIMLPFLYVLLLLIHVAFSLRSPSPFDSCCLFSTHAAFSPRSPSPFESCCFFSNFTFWFMLPFLYIPLLLSIHVEYSWNPLLMWQGHPRISTDKLFYL